MQNAIATTLRENLLSVVMNVAQNVTSESGSAQIISLLADITSNPSQVSSYGFDMALNALTTALRAAAEARSNNLRDQETGHISCFFAPFFYYSQGH
jgi:hypothetical protein